jgi:hypothetical protein
LKYPASAKVNTQELASYVGHQSIDVCKQEIEGVKSANRNPSRRLLMYAVYSMLVGLEGSDKKGGLLAVSTDPKQKQFVETVRSKAASLYSYVDSSTELDGDTQKELAGKLADLESVLGPKPAAGKEVAEPSKPSAPDKPQDAGRAPVDRTAADAK